jgi:hypothetical protein
MIRRLLVHPDHASQQLGLREELEAASAVVAKLHARIARVTSFVRFMARHGVVSEAAAGTFGYFAALPNELILCILSHTDPKTLLLSVSALNRTWRQMAEDSNVWGVLYGRRWSSPFPSHAAIPRSASFYDMDVDDYNPRERKLKRRRYGWMERFKERACVDRNWLKRGSYSVCVKRAETQGEYTRLACADSRLYLAHRAYPPGHAGQQRYFLSHHLWEEQGAFTDTTGTTIATPHRAAINDIQADSDLAITSSADGTALAWDVGTGSLLHQVARYEGEIVQARLASLTALVTASDRSVGLWDVRKGERTADIEHARRVCCIGVNSDDDSPIVSGCGTAASWTPRWPCCRPAVYPPLSTSTSKGCWWRATTTRATRHTRDRRPTCSDGRATSSCSPITSASPSGASLPTTPASWWRRAARWRAWTSRRQVCSPHTSPGTPTWRASSSIPPAYWWSETGSWPSTTSPAARWRPPLAIASFVAFG